MRLVLLCTHFVSVRSRSDNDDASMMHWGMEEGSAEFEDENLMQFSGGASTEYPSLDEQESVREARSMHVIKDPCHDPVGCGGSDEYAFWQRSTEVEHDEHTLLQESDEQTFFQWLDEPETMEDHELSARSLGARSRVARGLVDDSMEDESSMFQQGDLEPCHDEHTLFQQNDEHTFFQNNDKPETMDDHHLSAHSRIFGEILDDSFETWEMASWDESSMFQQGGAPPDPDHDESSLFQYDEADTVDDALAEEEAEEDYILMQYEGVEEYPSLAVQSAVLEARSETLRKGDPYRFFQKEEL